MELANWDRAICEQLIARGLSIWTLEITRGFLNQFSASFSPLHVSLNL